MLERFQGYTLGTLLAEDAELLQMVHLVDRDREVNAENAE